MKLPQILYLEPTNRCNLRCRGCILYREGWEPNRDLSLTEVALITDQLPELERIVLHGIGEPLLNRQLADIIRHLKGRDAHVLFNSNGILLDGRKQQELIRAGLDELRISLDAASARGYRTIRNSNKFEEIVENLRSFVARQKQQETNRPRLSLWFLATKENIFELPDFVRLAAEIGISEVYLQRLVYFQDDTGYGLARNTQSLQGSSQGYSELIQKSQDLARRLEIQFNASGLSTPVESLQADAVSALPWSRCHRPSSLMYITANGNVLPCCIAPFSTVEYASLVLGNVFNETLADIWQGARYKAFRRKQHTETPPTCCRGCGVQWSL